MKYLIHIFPILLSTFCYSQNKITEQDTDSQTSGYQSHYQRIPTSEIPGILKMAIDLPELQQYFHIETHPERAPLTILEFGDINEQTLKEITKFGQPLQVLTKEEIKARQIQNYIGVGDWTPVNNTLRLQLDYPIEGIMMNYLFKKVNSVWELTDSIIMEN